MFGLRLYEGLFYQVEENTNSRVSEYRGKCMKNIHSCIIPVFDIAGVPTPLPPKKKQTNKSFKCILNGLGENLQSSFMDI